MGLTNIPPGTVAESLVKYTLTDDRLCEEPVPVLLVSEMRISSTAFPAPDLFFFREIFFDFFSVFPSYFDFLKNMENMIDYSELELQKMTRSCQKRLEDSYSSLPKPLSATISNASLPKTLTISVSMHVVQEMLP